MQLNSFLVFTAVMTLSFSLSLKYPKNGKHFHKFSVLHRCKVIISDGIAGQAKQLSEDIRFIF